MKISIKLFVISIILLITNSEMKASLLAKRLPLGKTTHNFRLHNTSLRKLSSESLKTGAESRRIPTDADLAFMSIGLAGGIGGICLDNRKYDEKRSMIGVGGAFITMTGIIAKKTKIAAATGVLTVAAIIARDKYKDYCFEKSNREKKESEDKMKQA